MNIILLLGEKEDHRIRRYMSVVRLKILSNFLHFIMLSRSMISPLS